MVHRQEMKKKLGLFLDAEPSWGGAFQYSQAVLDAVSSLPRDRFEVVVAYASETWASQLKEHELPAFPVHLASWKILSSKRVCEYLPISWWRSMVVSQCWDQAANQAEMSYLDLPRTGNMDLSPSRAFPGYHF